MKKLLKLLKYLNNFTNNHLTAKEEAEQILKFLLLKNSTIKCIEIWESLEIAIECEMRKRESEAAYTCRTINGKWKSRSNVYNSDFDNPLSEIETNFEILSKC